MPSKRNRLAWLAALACIFAAALGGCASEGHVRNESWTRPAGWENSGPLGMGGSGPRY